MFDASHNCAHQLGRVSTQSSRESKHHCNRGLGFRHFKSGDERSVYVGPVRQFFLADLKATTQRFDFGCNRSDHKEILCFAHSLACSASRRIYAPAYMVQTGPGGKNAETTSQQSSMSKTQPASSETSQPRLRQASTVRFLTLAEVDEVPRRSRLSANADALGDDASDAISLQKHLLSYEGCALDREEFIWGLYGTTDQRDLRTKAYVAAKQSRKLVLEIEGRYKLKDLSRVRLGFDRDAVLETGYLHADRLNAAFRDELRSHLLQAASRRRADFSTDQHDKLSFGDLLLAQPWLLQELFGMDDRIMMVVHRVRPVWNPGSRLGVQVCTMRRIAERIVGMNVSFRPELVVRC